MKTINYKGREIVEAIAPNGQHILHFFEDGQEYGMAFTNKYGEEEIALNALKFDIDLLEVESQDSAPTPV